MQHKTLIKKLKKQNAQAQKWTYEKYAPKFLGVCLRYLKDPFKAEDALLEGFTKIFKEIDKYRDIGNFESWMYKVIVNQCLMEIRKRHNFNIHLNPSIYEASTEYNALDQLYEQDLLKLINKLPEGCKTVFNLYIIDGYSHKEIAYQLGIAEGTSKSQLSLAKKKLKEMLKFNTEIKQNGK